MAYIGYIEFFNIYKIFSQYPSYLCSNWNRLAFGKPKKVSWYLFFLEFSRNSSKNHQFEKKMGLFVIPPLCIRRMNKTIFVSILPSLRKEPTLPKSSKSKNFRKPNKNYQPSARDQTRRSRDQRIDLLCAYSCTSTRLWIPQLASFCGMDRILTTSRSCPAFDARSN